MKKEKILPQNVGVCHERVNHEGPGGQPNLERIFQKHWNRENTERPGINGGYAIAQGLMKVKKDYEYDGPEQDNIKVHGTMLFEIEKLVYNLTEREQRIVATVIQWLGTNCGFAFLQRCLQEAGYQFRDVGQEKRHRIFMEELSRKRKEAAEANSRFAKIRKTRECKEFENRR